MSTVNDFTHLANVKPLCINDCYPPSTIVLHPITKNIITSNKNFCATNPFVAKEKNIKEKKYCKNITNLIENKYINLKPTYFNNALFLKLFYQIESFYDAIEFIKKNDFNPYQENRIINASWISFSYDIDNIPNCVIEYYQKKINTEWKKDFLNKLGNSYNLQEFEKNIKLANDNILICLFNKDNIHDLKDKNKNINEIIKKDVFKKFFY